MIFWQYDDDDDIRVVWVTSVSCRPVAARRSHLKSPPAISGERRTATLDLYFPTFVFGFFYFCIWIFLLLYLFFFFLISSGERDGLPLWICIFLLLYLDFLWDLNHLKIHGQQPVWGERMRATLYFSSFCMCIFLLLYLYFLSDLVLKGQLDLKYFYICIFYKNSALKNVSRFLNLYISRSYLNRILCQLSLIFWVNYYGFNPDIIPVI